MPKSAPTPMLFEGFGLHYIPDSWQNHPFHPGNNINGIGTDVVEAEEIHTLQHPAIKAVQEAYVRKVIETVNGLDNVLYENLHVLELIEAAYLDSTLPGSSTVSQPEA